MKGNAELLAHMDMIVAAGGGERDAQVDLSVLAGLAGRRTPRRFVNERLMNDLRPTLFLAQLAEPARRQHLDRAWRDRLVAHLHGRGIRAGVDAVRIAQARIAAGQSDLALVGGAYNAERWEVILHFALGRSLIRDDAPKRVGARRPAWRSAPSGRSWCWKKSSMRRRAAQSRSPAARRVASDHVRRTPGAVTGALERMWSTVQARLDPAHAAVISGATGVQPATLGGARFLASTGPCGARDRHPFRPWARAAVSG